jgi:hypothetical protein
MGTVSGLSAFIGGVACLAYMESGGRIRLCLVL